MVFRVSASLASWKAFRQRSFFVVLTFNWGGGDLGFIRVTAQVKEIVRRFVVRLLLYSFAFFTDGADTTDALEASCYEVTMCFGPRSPPSL